MTDISKTTSLRLARIETQQKAMNGTIDTLFRQLRELDEAMEHMQRKADAIVREAILAALELDNPPNP